MKNLNQYIQEKLVINNDSSKNYKYHPRNNNGLCKLVDKLIQERGDDADLNDIDVRDITDFSNVFKEQFSFCGDISRWNMSKAENMADMFFNCTEFNGDLSNWNTSKFVNMNGMFYKCKKFNGNLSNWNVSKVTDMSCAFEKCTNFEGKGLENWDVNKVEDMTKIFSGCENFNSNLSSWNVKNACKMWNMFYKCNSLKNKPWWYHE